jgi:dihydroorotate dehydrogenase electron transfer subunit
MKDNLPKMAKVLEVKVESASTKTLFLELGLKATPGQFVMAWIPGMNEKPYSLSFVGDRLGLTVAAVGSFSKKMCEAKQGDLIGIRGPYGKGFKLIGETVAVVGGGCGSAPLGFLIEELVKAGKKVFFIVGARTKGELLFVERGKAAGAEVIVCTDDGSEGKKGFTTEALEELLGREKIDCVYTCGPEVMMKKVVEICLAKGVDCQASLERYMKCGFGICGQCAIDGLLVCKDGPVFPLAKLSKLKEFGNIHRNACGTEEKV